ncbi:hypothetical protein [Methanofollis fontis]|uniref:Transglutaminase-like domain-containing protein n=1 Tax=Methanofollis fontis TaxID=2052832 RepID=A0A483CVW2_9EURY|nr:hypothetical protein [Methanofollis fontis]TAJ45667.1 hypothetical protein CUJ86_02825 [Methanofollis fontis]
MSEPDIPKGNKHFFANRHVIATVIVITLLFTGVLVASGIVSFIRPMAIYPSITPIATDGGTEESEFIFPFEEIRYRLRMPVDVTVYSGARTGSKSAILYGDIPDEEWMPGYYRAFIDDPHQESLYSGLLSAFSGIRDEQALDSDRYLEMITAFVQSIPYETHPEGAPPKFPVETITERTGDCDDKSLLLAALLTRAGYDVALLDFLADAHMAVGVRSKENSYGSTGYAYIETTAFNFVGDVPENLADGVHLTGEPLVIRIGEGNTTYGAGSQTASIIEREMEARAVIEEVGPGVAEHSARLQAAEERLRKEREEIESLLSSGQTVRYNTLVPGYNSQVAAYNQDLGTYGTEAAYYDRAVRIYNYIVGHRYDRQGTYEWLRSNPLQP